MLSISNRISLLLKVVHCLKKIMIDNDYFILFNNNINIKIDILLFYYDLLNN
jgi:hypothetical protein